MPLIASGFRPSMSVITPVGLDWVQLCLPNPARWYLQIDPIGNPTGFIGFQPLDPGNQGLLVTSTTGRIEFTFKDHPSLVGQGWFGRGYMGPVAITEIIFTG